MHRCLLAEDILHEVFDHVSNISPDMAPELDVENQAQIDLAALAGLARTCKAFHIPAIRILWWSLASIAPLMRCLPADAFEIKDDVLSLTRDLIDADYSRIHHYAPYVGDLNLQPEMWQTLRLGSQVLPVLYSRNPCPGPLLPNVISLAINAQHFQYHALLARMVIGTELEELCIDTNGGEEQSKAIWDNVAAVVEPVCSNLKTLFLLTKGDKEGWVEKVQKLVSLIPKLTSIVKLVSDLDCISSQALRDLQQLPNLQILDIVVPESGLEQLYDLGEGSTDLCFLHLTSLDLLAASLESCQLLFRKVKFPSLISLKIYRTGEDVWDLGSFFEVLSEAGIAGHLEALGISEEDEEQNEHLDAYSHPVTLETFEPLFSFKELMELVIASCLSPTLSDSDLLKMTTSWPKLVTLSLYDGTVLSTPKLSLHGIERAVAACPSITMVCLRVDATIAHSFAADGDVMPFSSLISLNLCTSPISNASDVATHISFLFPVLQMLEVGWAGDDPETYHQLPIQERRYIDEWKQVSALMNPV